MRTTITVKDDIIQSLLKDTGTKNLPQAITKLVEAWERKQVAAKLMSLKGKVKFAVSWQELRAAGRERDEMLYGPRPR